jgi:hypothetical protein
MAEYDETEEENGDEISFDVLVVDQEGEPVAGETVTAFFSYVWWPQTHSEEYTDGVGHAHFASGHPAKPLSVEIYVRGRAHGPYPLEDGDGFTVEVSYD